MPDVDLEQAKNVFQLVILTAMSDGQTGGDEAKAVAKLRKDEPVLQAVADVGSVGKEIHERAGTIGIDLAMRAAAKGLRDRFYQETAFRLCAKVMGADGETDLEEAQLLGDMQEVFGFSADDVKRLLK